MNTVPVLHIARTVTLTWWKAWMKQRLLETSTEQNNLKMISCIRITKAMMVSMTAISRTTAMRNTQETWPVETTQAVTLRIPTMPAVLRFPKRH